MKITNIIPDPLSITYELSDTPPIHVVIKKINRKWSAEPLIKPLPLIAEDPNQAAKELGHLLLQAAEGIMAGDGEFGRIDLESIDLKSIDLS